MQLWKKYGLSGALVAGLVSGARGQIPPAGAAAAPPAAAAAPAAGAAGPLAPAAATTPAGPAAAAAPATNLWSFLCPSPAQTAACKAKFCASTFGQLINNSLQPASALSGGLIPGCCPPISPVDLAKPADTPEGAAARIQQDEAQAKARRAAVRYLGTVDCRYWPEAQAALIAGLRADRNECVRLEAALALGRGCSCTPATLKALTLTVSGSREDGNPAECSPRVKAMATVALEHCLHCYSDVQPAPPCKPPVPSKPAPADVLPPPRREQGPEQRPQTDLPPNQPAQAPANSTQRGSAAGLPRLVQEAHVALQRARLPLAPVPTGSPLPAGTSGESRPVRHNGLLELLTTTLSLPPAPRETAPPPAPPTPARPTPVTVAAPPTAWPSRPLPPLTVAALIGDNYFSPSCCLTGKCYHAGHRMAQPLSGG